MKGIKGNARLPQGAPPRQGHSAQECRPVPRLVEGKPGGGLVMVHRDAMALNIHLALRGLWWGQGCCGGCEGLWPVLGPGRAAVLPLWLGDGPRIGCTPDNHED